MYNLLASAQKRMNAKDIGSWTQLLNNNKKAHSIVTWMYNV